MLELKEIRKSYKIGESKQEVLKGININFRKNEFTSILGSSGSGKTTLLNIIGGLDKYDSGDLIIEGVSTKNYNDRNWDTYRNYRVGFIFQNYNLIMHQSVYSNVEIALTLSGVSKTERKKKVLDALEKVGLKEHVNKKPNQLSGGQMQRVAIARALVNNPEIILADEPTGALDSETSVQIMDLLKEIAKDKLIIMVTHNPELAKEYSTRIIELKDGLIINDSNPYNEVDEDVNNRETKKTSMSFFTSLLLSFNNLLTKKGRAFMTAFAGSIGIIGIALILALSNGVSNYVSNMERDSLTDYPISIERNSMDVSSLFSGISGELKNDTNKEEGKVYSRDDIVVKTKSSNSGFMKKNNLKEFKKFVDSSEELKEKADLIQYDYDFDLQIFTNDYGKVNPSDLQEASSSSNLFSSNSGDGTFKELDGRQDVINNKYKVLAGHLPENEKEMILVVGNDDIIPDSVLYALNIKNKDELKDDFEKTIKDSNYKIESKAYTYNDFLNRTYKLILNTDYYKEENGIYIDNSNNQAYMKNKIDNGLDIKIVGVVKNEDESSSYVGYKHELKDIVLDEISKTSIFKKQIENKTVNVITGEEFDNISDNYDDLAKKLAIYEKEDPSSINIYPKDYDSKEGIIKIIDGYNEEKKNNNQQDLVLTYSDGIKSIVNGVTSIIKGVSYILIGFVAISLIVSSIMISIITYISVLERTKEIGILRAIGASKKDIKRVFRAETIIEGFVAGALGVIATVILTIPINAVVKALAKIENIAKLPFGSAIILILLSILLNVIAGSKPSSMAAKKDPVEALRTE